ncbi:MAG: class I SAM-dependent methyltransferase [Gammaproteobacteria bacterium]
MNKPNNSSENTMVACPVCDHPETHYFVSKNDYTFNRCTECDFIFLNPMPNQDELNAQYTDDNKETEPTYNKTASRLRRAFIKLPRFLPYAIGKHTLDFGCGGGFIAYALSFIAKSSTGIDISENAVAYAKQRFKRASYFCMDFVQLIETNDQYDFVYSSEVIEHVSEIKLYMKTLAHLVKKGGYAYITTPDLGHPKVPENITEWGMLCPPIHVQHFTKKTIDILFRRYGFKVVKFYKHKKPGLIFLSQKL